MTALARRLRSLGHESVLFGALDAEPSARAAGVDFLPVGEKEFPVGSTAEAYAPTRQMHGYAVLDYWGKHIHPELLAALFKTLPTRLVQARVEAMVVDASCAFAELAAMSAGIPYVQTWLALHCDVSGTTPPHLFSWPDDRNPAARERNLAGVKKSGQIFDGALPVARAYAREAGLGVEIKDAGSTASPLAVLTQAPKEFDYPDIPWPSQFHYAGPYSDSAIREPIDFAWDRLDGRPLIYASLGTLVNGLIEIHRTILQAASRSPDHQFVFSVGGNVQLDELGPVPSNVVVAMSAPQLELLQRAVLCITHAGLNTVLEALSVGVPMVAIPIAYEQFGVAARVRYHQVGELIEIEELSDQLLLEKIVRVLRSPHYRTNARRFQEVLAQTDGLGVAADMIERAFLRSR